jgi:hypothetical protein
MEEMARAGGAGLFAKYIDDRPLYAQQLPSKPARVASLSKARAPLAVVCFLGLITLVIERAELKIIQKGTCRTSRGDKRMWRVLSSRLIRWRLLARTSAVLVLGLCLDCMSTATTSVIVLADQKAQSQRGLEDNASCSAA